MIKTARRGSTAVAGLDAVLWLRFTQVDGELVSCEAHGTRHRRPVDVRVAVETGRTLADAGIPWIARAAR